MFADAVLLSRGFFENEVGVTPALFDGIIAAPRVVLSDEVVSAAKALDLPSGPAPYPFPELWVEWREGEYDHGILIGDDGGAVYFRITDNPARPGGKELTMFPLDGLAPVLDFKPDTPMNARFKFAWINPAGVGRLLGAAFYLMASPKVTGYREADVSDVNRKRMRMGREPLLSYREIVLKVTPGERSASRGNGAGAGKALHLCRAFMRVRLGRVEMVRAHWRGDRARGVKLASYRVES